jgi:hypothetical protein
LQGLAYGQPRISIGFRLEEVAELDVDRLADCILPDCRAFDVEVGVRWSAARREGRDQGRTQKRNSDGVVHARGMSTPRASVTVGEFSLGIGDLE